MRHSEADTTPEIIHHSRLYVRFECLGECIFVAAVEGKRTTLEQWCGTSCFPELELAGVHQGEKLRVALLSICLSYNSLFSWANAPDTSHPGLACQIRLIVDHGDGGQQSCIV